MDRNIHFKIMAVFLVLWWACPVNISEAKLMAEMHIATGTIINIHENIITLDQGIKFHPGIADIASSLKTGMKVTIRYYIEADGTYRYSAVAMGENSLSATPMEKKKPLKNKNLK